MLASNSQYSLIHFDGYCYVTPQQFNMEPVNPNFEIRCMPFTFEYFRAIIHKWQARQARQTLFCSHLIEACSQDLSCQRASQRKFTNTDFVNKVVYQQRTLQYIHPTIQTIQTYVLDSSKFSIEKYRTTKFPSNIGPSEKFHTNACSMIAS